MTKLLFVCTGNTCRSSMAEALCKDLLLKKEKEDYEVLSAGLAADSGHRAARQAIAVLKKEGIDLTEHTTTLLTAELVTQADLILTMTYRHKLTILNNYAQITDKVYTLKGYARKLDSSSEEETKIDLDISDPFGQPIEIYQECAQEIKGYLKKVIENLD
ncbi:low molecular weight protein arginine phosphatase [Halanaerobaculum tunisiense]